MIAHFHLPLLSRVLSRDLFHSHALVLEQTLLPHALLEETVHVLTLERTSLPHPSHALLEETSHVLELEQNPPPLSSDVLSHVLVLEQILLPQPRELLGESVLKTF